MKPHTLLILILFSFLNCKSSMNKAELIAENKVLKERLTKYEASDALNNKTAIELKNMNVVYRGVSNPIYISKPNAVSFEATAPGLNKLDSLGNYNLNAGTGRTIDITIKSKLKNGDSLTEIKTLRIKDIRSLKGAINGLGCGNKCEILLTKNALANGKVGVNVNDFLFDWKFVVKGFKLALENKKIIDVVGSTFNDSAKQRIQNLNIGDIIIIFDIKVRILGTNNYRLKNPAPVVIRIVE